LYKGHRFPVEIISHCVWLYHRFPLSLRDVEQMMAHRGVSVSYDTIVRHEAPVRREALGVEGGERPSRWVVAAAW
jgi:putative transposase